MVLVVCWWIMCGGGATDNAVSQDRQHLHFTPHSKKINNHIHNHIYHDQSTNNNNLRPKNHQNNMKSVGGKLVVGVTFDFLKYSQNLT